MTEAQKWEASTRPTFSETAQVRTHLELYLREDSADKPSWHNGGDIPTEEEVGCIVDGKLLVPEINIKPNKHMGAFQDKDDYLSTHATLMRQDGISPLRQSLYEFRDYPEMMEKDSIQNTRIYDNVYINGLTVARGGLALRIEFSTRRAGKLIRWAQSKRLKTGSLVVLSPVADKFRTKCIVAVVAARRLSWLDVMQPTKPRIQIYVGNPAQLEIDPQQEFIMLEALGGYWEAYRYTYQALKKLHYERFPLAEHIVSLNPELSPPRYREDRPVINLSSAAQDNSDLIRRQNVIEDWPEFTQPGLPEKFQSTRPPADHNVATPLPVSGLDNSQMQALRRVLTQRLAIVQGPPGTGKTFVSIIALRILLDNMATSDPPIIVTAQTNHALDQLLRLISRFEPNFVRIGGQTTDKEIIQPRTLFELKERHRGRASDTTKGAVAREKALSRNLEDLLQPYTADLPLSPEICFEQGLINEQQRDSILIVENSYQGCDAEDITPMEIWCDESITRAKKKQDAAIFGEYEDFEEFEKLDEADLEAIELDDERFETLHGRFFELFIGYVGHGNVSMPDTAIVKLLECHQNLNDIDQKYRGTIYNYFKRAVSASVTARIREKGLEAQMLSRDFKIGKWEKDYQILRESAKIIGLTTTGLSKYRALVTALKPKIVLIEEAAETLEGYVSAACFDSLEHLILVGDHQQLRGHCTDQTLEGDPVHFDMSMFERLVKNNIPFTQLKTQRRMRPEIRQIINPIYPELEDHVSVCGRENIAGMGDVNVSFFHHIWHESNDDALSKQNEIEAKMIAEFFTHLVYNGCGIPQITVLTFYNGQVKLLRRILNQQPLLLGRRVNVHTVDSYQGEENDIILLSLVRNNEHEKIGFLENINRACVALSRARKGFYIFGRAGLLCANSEKWREIILVLQSMGVIQHYLPLQCSRHQKVVHVKHPTDFARLSGGCEEPCGRERSCGHPCELACHPFSCDDALCQEDCERVLHCGHTCSRGCGVRPCQCDSCTHEANTQSQKEKITKGKKAWADFAAGGYLQANAEALKAQQEDNSPLEAAMTSMQAVCIDKINSNTNEDGFGQIPDSFGISTDAEAAFDSNSIVAGTLVPIEDTSTTIQGIIRDIEQRRDSKATPNKQPSNTVPSTFGPIDDTFGGPQPPLPAISGNAFPSLPSRKPSHAPNKTFNYAQRASQPNTSNRFPLTPATILPHALQDTFDDPEETPEMGSATEFPCLPGTKAKKKVSTTQGPRLLRIMHGSVAPQHLRASAPNPTSSVGALMLPPPLRVQTPQQPAASGPQPSRIPTTPEKGKKKVWKTKFKVGVGEVE